MGVWRGTAPPRLKEVGKCSENIRSLDFFVLADNFKCEIR